MLHSRTRRAALAGLGAFSLLLASGARAQEGSLRVRHAKGVTELPALPQRVAVFDLAVLDILLALDVPVVGVPKVQFPAYLTDQGANKLPTIGTLFEPEEAAVRAVRPDLIIVAGRSSGKYAELSKIAPTLDLSTSTQGFVASVAQNILLLGRLFGRQQQAAVKTEELLASVRRLNEKGAKAGKGLLLFAAGSGLAPQPAHTRFGILYELVGIQPAITAADLPTPRPRAAQEPAPEAGTPAAAAAEARRAQQTDEQEARLARLLDDRNPDWLFVLDRATATGGEAAAPARLAAAPAIVKTSAWQKRQVVHLDAPTWYLVGGGLTALENSIEQIEAAFDAAR